MDSRVIPFAALLLLPALAFAQDSSSTNATPFRRGQWAAQFQAGISFGSLGFIKFRSPTHALVLDFRINGAHTEDLTRDSTGVNQLEGLGSNASVEVRCGSRRYGGGGVPRVGNRGVRAARLAGGDAVFLGAIAAAPPFDQSPAAPGRSQHDEADDG